MGKLSGKVAIVTGSGRGIGKAIAEAYLKEDARVTVTAAKQRDEIEALVEANGSERVLALLADVTVPGDCERIVTETLGRFEKVDVLVNNAGRGMKYVSSNFPLPSQHAFGRRILRRGGWSWTPTSTGPFSWLG